MRRALLTGGLGLVLLALFAALSAAPAQAQIDIPPPPEEAQVVLQVISPIVSPTCANAGLAVVLLPTFFATADVPVPSEVIRAFGPVVTVCGFFPAPTQRIACPADDVLGSVVAQIAVAVLGQVAPLDVRVAGPAIEVLNEAIGLLSGDAAPLAASAVSTIGCRELDLTVGGDDGGAALDVPTAPPGTRPPEIPSGSFSPPVVSAPTSLERSPELAARPAVTGGPLAGFDYPAVFAVPVALLALVAFLGWVFARPVD
jgi:hypothetical protein